MLDEREQERHDAYIRGLRELADWFERHPDLPSPHANTDAFLSARDREKALLLVRAAGSVNKGSDDDDIILHREFGGNVRLRIYLEKKATCTRRLVGTKVIPARPETILPATPEREEEIFEWDCPDSLLGTLSSNGEAAQQEEHYEH